MPLGNDNRCHSYVVVASLCRYALLLIASYNVWDLIGRYVPLIEHIKLKSRKGLLIAVVSRFLLIPAFYYTAKYGDQGWMIMLTSLLGLSNGYLTICVLTEAPKGYKVGVWLFSTSTVVFCIICSSYIHDCACRDQNKMLWATCLCFPY